jgi:hypothetical protein
MKPLALGCNDVFRRAARGFISSRRVAGIASWLVAAVLLVVPIARAAGQGTSDGVASGTSPRGDGQRQSGGQGTVYVTPVPVWFPPTPDIHPECTGGSPGDYERRMEALDKNGPQTPPIYVWNAAQFSIMGFSKGNWPIFIDYFLEHPGTLLVVVAPDGRSPHVFLTNSAAGHTNARFQLPANMGDDLRVSQYLIVPLGKGLGLHVLGISAGPQAVGSMGIDQVSFGPNSIQISHHQKAEYSFHAIKDFKKSGVTFIRLAKSNTGEIIAADVGEKNIGSVIRDGEKKGDWDGTPKPPKEAVKQYPPEQQRWLLEPTGQHVLQVRAWFGVNEGGDWVFASSDTQVSVQ